MSVEAKPYGIDRHEPRIDIGMLDETLQSLEEPPRNMKETAEGLGRLAIALETTHIPPAFTWVYGTLSTSIHRAMEDGHFDRPEDIDHTSGKFAWYFYKNLKPYRDFMKEGDPQVLNEIEKPWVLPILDPRVRDPTTPDYLRFWVGMTTHITAKDLLASLMYSRPTDAYRNDFLSGVNREIKLTTDQLAPALIPGHSLARATLKPIIRSMIAFDRRTVWSNYVELRDSTPVINLADEREKRRGTSEPADELLEKKYRELDKLAIWRNEVTLKMGRAANAFVVATERLPDPFKDRVAA